MKTLQEAFAFRAAIKEYNKEAVLTDEQVSLLLETIRMAPSSYGLQPYKILVIKNKDTREKLKTVSYGQGQVTDASHFVVFASRINENQEDVTKFIENIMSVRGVTREDLAGYEGMMNGALSAMSEEGRKAWAAKQAYIGLGTLLTAAALLGIDATPMEGFSPAEYDAILDLAKDGYTTAVICALGMRAETESYSKMQKVRKSKADFIQEVI